MKTIDTGLHYPLVVDALPQGWTAAHVHEFVDDVQSGFACGRHNSRSNGVPHLRPMNVSRNGKIDLDDLRYVPEDYDELRLSCGDVLFNNTNSPELIGKTALVGSEAHGMAFSNHMTRIRFYGAVDPRYAAYQLHYLWMARYFLHRCVKHVNQASISTRDFSRSIPFIAAPLNEQLRIVAKIDELFSGLDSGLESLRTAREQLRIYRQILLKSAFEGKLTVQWREDNSTKLEAADQLFIRIKKNRDARYQKLLKKWKTLSECGERAPKPRPPSYPDPFSDEENGKLVRLPDNWRWAKLGDLFGVYVGATPSRKNSRYWNGKVNWVSSGEVRFCRLSSTREKITLEGLENTSTESHPAGTVMLAMIGEGKTRGQAAILDINACHNQNTAAIRVSETDCIPEYLYYYLFFQYQITRTLGSGNNQKALNKDRVSNMSFPLAPVNEQRELVAAIEARMSVIDRVEDDIGLEIRKAEVLRQSILKKAFTGELVAQDSNDEPASVHLARIRSQNAEDDVGRQKSRRKDAA